MSQLPNFNELAHKAQLCGEVRATLVVNCMPDRPLYKLSIEYDDKHSVIWNMCVILEELIDRVNKGETEECM